MVEITGAVQLGRPTAKLPRDSVYRSVAGRAEAEALYDEALNRLPYPVQTNFVHTSYGRTHITVGGNQNGRPLIVIPGMSVSGPIMMDFFGNCAQRRLLIALDLVGHPGRSEDRVHSPSDHGFGRWLAEVLDALNLDRADIATASFGASVALDLTATDPDRVGKLALLMPAGLTPRLPYLRLYLRFFIPWMRYRYFPNRHALPRIARHFGSSLTEYDFRYLDMVIRHTTFWRHRPAGPFFAKDLAGYREGVFLVTAGLDQVLPRSATRSNAIDALRIAEEIFLPGSTHMPAASDMADVHPRVADYFG